MKRVLWTAAFVMAAMTGHLHAQQTWVQIEAQPSLAEAEDRAQAYAGAFPNVQGYRLGSGWYGIVLGPFASPEEAARQLDVLKTERMIPADSFIAEPGALGRRFWPAGVDAAGVAPAEPLTTAIPEPEPEPEPEPQALPDETVSEAQDSEALLSSEARMDLQRAMQWFGVYPGKIDGNFGKGTRAAMADWQGRNGYDPTGVLTTAQRAALTGAWAREREELGISAVTEPEAGIRIDLPLGLVEFDGYQPPFVTYKDKSGAGYQAFLISRRGDQKTLVQLYDRVQALSVIPMEGDRAVGKSSFTIMGEGNGSTAYAEARLEGGFIKGFALIAPTADAARRTRVLAAMQASFQPTSDVALDENLGEPSATAPADLTSGLDIRRPVISRTGVFIDAQGRILTTSEVLKSCARITIDGQTEATVAFEDPTLGFAILAPATPLAPRAFAQIAPALPRLDADVALAGYSYEDKLSAPVMSSGTFSEGQGLNGEKDLARLTLVTLPGDAGGAVLDGSGAMVGMLMPRTDEGGRELPRDVSFALQSAAIAAALAPKAGQAGAVTLTSATGSGTLPPEDLSKRARDMTVLVSCWN